MKEKSPSLRECIAAAVKGGYAIGHFNASNLEGIHAIADAAHDLGVPVIVGLSEGERDFVGVKEAVALIKSIRQERDQAIFLNADHTYSLERAKEAIDAGFDSVIIDGAQLSFEENISVTRKCVEYAREASKRAGNSEILVEGELGYIGSSSKMLDAIPDGAAVGDGQMTRAEDAKRFVSETGIDLLAPAIGNIHGVVRGGDPALNSVKAGEIAAAAAVPLVLHGASGNTADDVKRSIKAGIAVVHVSTELRIAYRSALVKSLSENPEELSPYKYLKPAKLAMQKAVEEKLRIFCAK